MPEWEAHFEINGLFFSGMEFSKNFQIDEDFELIKGRKSKPESAIACLRVKTKEGEEMFHSESYNNARKRVLNFISMHSVFRGLSPTIFAVGASGIDEAQPLGTSKLMFAEMSIKIPDEEKPRIFAREYGALNRSIAFFKLNERILHENPYLMNAVHYFYHASLARRIEEKLINFIVSLEALYVTEPLELSYRLALRVACLVGNTYTDRTPKEIAAEIRNLYSKRSRVVHGNIKEITYDEISRLEDYSRKSITRFLRLASSQRNREEILNLLDDSIFDEELRNSFQDNE